MGKKTLSNEEKHLALTEILNYFNQSYGGESTIIETELDIAIETESYILNGRIDLLTQNKDNVELIDFKTRSKPDMRSTSINPYYNQLCMYVYLLKEKHGIYPQRSYVYWTAEPDRDLALTPFHIDDDSIVKALLHFDNIVGLISKKRFVITQVPEQKICDDCDFKRYCTRQGIISV